MQVKKQRRAQAANYLIEGKDKYILRYLEENLIKILKDSGYHSEEWEETDPEEDEEIIEEAITKKSTSIYIYEKCIPSISAPSWCLNQEALKRFNCSSINILVYDYDTDTDDQDNSDNDTEDKINNEEIPDRINKRKKRKTNEEIPNRINKRKKRKTKKQKRSKKHKSK
ncbi:hypothetical protein RclHR1_27500002 [Rhizophagus clarus]|uniref:Uncharacterized protein n=1 Tax=Rhizophagus clarus TaxID=94130 RepID=A0A2Z6RWX5_9GLOM|nr:hypothetical protein RclHR1_27500002 [Rhizophagus clarus]